MEKNKHCVDCEIEKLPSAPGEKCWACDDVAQSFAVDLLGQAHVDRVRELETELAA
jgi:hypothetical protein